MGRHVGLRQDTEKLGAQGLKEPIRYSKQLPKLSNLDDIIIITLIVLGIRILWLWLIVRWLLLTISLSAIGIGITLILGIVWLLAAFVVSYRLGRFIASVLDFHFFHFAAIFLDIQFLILILNLSSQSIVNLLLFLKIRKHLVVIFQLAVRVFIYPDIEEIMAWFLLVRSFKYLYYVSFIVCDILVPFILLKFGVGEWLALNT